MMWDLLGEVVAAIIEAWRELSFVGKAILVIIFVSVALGYGVLWALAFWE